MKKHNISILFIILATSIISSKTFAQDNPNAPPSPPKKPFKDRLFVGGNIGLQFGTLTYIDISPKVGYKLTERFAAGIGATYIYINDKRYRGFEYSTDIYGGRVFGQYKIFDNVLAYSEFEVLNGEVYDDLLAEMIRRNITSLLVGGGYVQPVGGRSNIMILVLWNLLESRYSIYQNPVIRIGFNLGFR